MTIRKLRLASILFSLSITILVISGCNDSTKPKEAPKAPVEPDTLKTADVKIPSDTLLTDFASIISGIAPMKNYS